MFSSPPRTRTHLHSILEHRGTSRNISVLAGHSPSIAVGLGTLPRGFLGRPLLIHGAFRQGTGKHGRITWHGKKRRQS